MTIKSSSGGKSTPLLRRQTQRSSATGPTTTTDTTVAAGWEESWSKTSSSNDNYHRSVKAGEVLLHQGLNYSKTTISHGTGYVLSTNQSGGSVLTVGCMRGTSRAGSVISNPNEDAERSSLQSQLDLKLLLKIKDQKMNIANLIAERNKTLDLFIKTARTLTSAAINLRHGNFAAAAGNFAGMPSRRAAKRFSRQYATDASQAAANAWIELQYGWKPLIAEAQGAGESLAKLSMQKQIAIASTSVDQELEYSLKSTSGNADRFQDCSTYIELFGQVVYKVDTGWAKTLSGIGLTNPLAPAWELTPWSFIIDWFIPIGDTINALDSTLGCSFVTGSKTSYISREKTCLDIYVRGGDSGVVTTKRTELSIIRTPLVAFPYVPIPRFKNPLSWPHAKNALALAVQRVR